MKKEVWSKFVKIYGGGPSIVREKPYIYSTPVEDNPVPPSRFRSPSPPSGHMRGQKSKKEKVLTEPNSRKGGGRSELTK